MLFDRVLESEEILVKELENNGFLPVKMGCIERSEHLTIYTDVDFDKFIKLAQRVDAKVVYYYYENYEIDDYLITEDLIERFSISQEEYKKIENQIVSYNEKIMNNNFDRPRSVTLNIQSGNAIIENEFVDNWVYEERPEFDPEEALLHIIAPDCESIEEYYEKQNAIEHEEAEKIQKDNDDKEKELAIELFNFLIDDKKFSLCTNRRMRFNYADNLRKSAPSINSQIEDYFADDYKAALFRRQVIDITWRLMKDGITSLEEAMEMF